MEETSLENLIKTRLYEISRRIKLLSEEANSHCTSSDIEINTKNAQICASKLENMVNRFNTELNEYFRVSTSPSADEISEMSSIQLDGEEVLSELKCILGRKNVSNSINIKKNKVFSAKLPTLSLPEFTGDVLAWCEFWDIYKSNIDDRPIPDVDKLLYLKSALKGEPRRIIDGLETTNSNYKIVVQILKDRYGKTSQIIDAHYRAINKVNMAHSISDCRDVYNDMERHLRVLQSLGENINHNHLRHVIRDKFPEDIIYEMKMKMSEETVCEMRRVLEIIITAREESSKAQTSIDSIEKETCTIGTLHTTDKETKRRINKSDFNDNRNSRWNLMGKRGYKKNDKRRDEPSTSRGYGTDRKRRANQGWDRKDNFKRNKISCVFCEKEHYSDQCPQYKTITERKDKLKGRCFKCLSIGHSYSDCKKKINCPHCNKTGHNRALCFEKLKLDGETTLTTVGEEELTLLQTAIVTVKHNNDTNNTLKCRILLDSGSQRSYITKETSRKLDLPIVEENKLSIFGFGKETPLEYYSPRVKLQLLTKTEEIIELYVNEIPTISKGVRPPNIHYEEYKDKILADDGSLGKRIDILIGNDYYFNLISTGKHQLNSNLFLINSEFGWIVSGKSPLKSQEKEREDTLSFITYCQNHDPNCKYYTEPDMPLKNMDISFLWTLESIGIADNPKSTREEEAIKHLNETIRYVDGRYLVKWPWISYPPEIPTNFGLAYGRLKGLLQRLTKDLMKEYNDILEEQIKNGIIEIITPENDLYTQKKPPIYYLPHHIIKQNGKKGRIVYDASGKLRDCKSLNECMFRGPSMIGDLVALLIQFRTHKVALTADVEKAFLQIGLQNEDRDVTRFIWIKDINKPFSTDNIEHLRFCRMPFGVIASPFLLTGTLKYHVSKRAPELIPKIIDKCYVDNLVTGTDSTEDAIQLYKTTRNIFSEISMNIRDWMSNDETFLKTIPSTFRAKQTEEIKILGLIWNVKNDTLKLNIKKELFNDENIKEPQSKRKVLSTIASMYDPCGICAPLVVPAKLLMQQLWETKLKWDTVLSDELQRKWEDIMHRLEAIQEVKLPRYTGLSNNIQKTEFNLHAFSDASKQAYASVIYLVTNNGIKRNVAFIMAKSKIVSKEERRNLRMPRLELLGCYLASKLLKYVKAVIEIPIKREYLWTDSQIVISWIYSNKLLPPFYARRVNTINEYKNLEVRYIDSERNPADLATRPELWEKKKNLWLDGPDFLKQEVIYLSPPMGQSPSETQVEDIQTSVNLLEVDDRITEKNNENQDFQESENRQISSDIRIIQDLQKEYFPQEYQGVKTSLAINLGLFKDIDGTLRCNGRMKNTNWSFDKRHPILIPRDTKFTNDMVVNIHRQNYHVGANHTLSKIREIYWIPKGKAYIQRILRKCPECVRHNGGPFKLPPAPALPAERVTYTAPFTYVGVDYMGPLMINNGTGNCKRWICLFTCLVVRAVHLEVVADLTAGESLLSLRRMMSTRGIPELIISDNAQCFKLLAETLSSQYCIDKKIRWKFITPLTPWAGGFYERLIGIVKNCLIKTLGKHMLNETQLATVVKEIEAVVNSRPLTSVDSELDHTLKPSDFLTAGRVITMNDPDRIIEPLDASSTKTELVRSWRRARIILNEFIDMFINRYLLSLRERYHHLPREPRIISKSSPSLGQVVQIKGESKNRVDWKVGRITALIPSADGVCRAAKVCVGKNEYTRSIAHLYPLEIEDTNMSSSSIVFNNENIQPMEIVVPKSQCLDIPIDTVPSSVIPEVTQSNTLPVEDDDVVQATETNIDIEKDNEKSIGITSLGHVNESLPEASQSEDIVSNGKPRRAAAVRALERIKDWTRDLSAFLLLSASSPSAGSVAFSANS